MHARARDIRMDCAEMYAPPKIISVSESIKQSLVTASGPYEPSLTPYMREPADMLASRKYRTVCFVGPARTGKTDAEVHVDRDHGKVEVILLKSATKKPKKLELTLFHSKDSVETVELLPMTPPQKGQVLYQGQLGPSSQAVLGFELRFGRQKIRSTPTSE